MDSKQIMQPEALLPLMKKPINIGICKKKKKKEDSTGMINP